MTDGAFMTGLDRAGHTSEILLTEIMILRARLALKDEQLTKANDAARELTAEVSRLRAARFTSQAERDAKIPRGVAPSQMSFPMPEDDAEVQASTDDEEPANESCGQPEGAEKTVQKSRSGPRKKKLSLSKYVSYMQPRETVILGEDGMICDACGSSMSVLSYDSYRELVVKPADIYVREIKVPTYTCRNCEKTAIDVPIVHAQLPIERPIPQCLASAEALAWLIYEKVAMGMPLYRMCGFFEESGVPINRTTLANWLIAASERFLIPLAECFRQRLICADIVHADETPFQVLHEKGRKAEQKSYMWIYCSTYGQDTRYVVLNYSTSRASACPRGFLHGFAGMIHCDGYSGYEKLENDVDLIFRSGCWAHVRRKWYEAAAAETSPCAARTGYEYVQKLFELEDKFGEMTAAERFFARLQNVLPHLREFHDWLDGQYAGETRVGKAVKYTLRQWPALMNYLSDGRLQTTNAAAELVAKGFAVGRKNFMFSSSPDGAHALAAAYSVVETAKANRIGAYRYLTWIFSCSASNIQFAETVYDFASVNLDRLERNEAANVRRLVLEELNGRHHKQLKQLPSVLNAALDNVLDRYLRPLRHELESMLLLQARARCMAEFMPDKMPEDWNPAAIGRDMPHRRR